MFHHKLHTSEGARYLNCMLILALSVCSLLRVGANGDSDTDSSPGWTDCIKPEDMMDPLSTEELVAAMSEILRQQGDYWSEHTELPKLMERLVMLQMKQQLPGKFAITATILKSWLWVNGNAPQIPDNNAEGVKYQLYPRVFTGILSVIIISLTIALINQISLLLRLRKTLSIANMQQMINMYTEMDDCISGLRLQPQ